MDVSNNGTVIPEATHDIYIPIYVLTGVFGAIFIIGPFLVPKGENRELIQHCIMMTAFCMWILWVTIYIAQMHPLKPPRLRNKTLAWVVNTERMPSTVTTTEQTPGIKDPSLMNPQEPPPPMVPPGTFALRNFNSES